MAISIWYYWATRWILSDYRWCKW